jgi:hypothetical protein
MKKGVRTAVLAAAALVLVMVVLIALDRCQAIQGDGTAGPTAAPTQGQLAAAAVGEEYVAYRPTEAGCDEVVDSGQSESCVWPSSIELVTRPEWEELLPKTEFYLIGLTARHAIPQYDYGFRRRLVGWHEGQYYTADQFDQLLVANEVTAIEDSIKETAAAALVLMILDDYVQQDIVFVDWSEMEVPPTRISHSLTCWTELQGATMRWYFVFEEERLRLAVGPEVLGFGSGDYVEASDDGVAPPPYTDYPF